MKCSDTLLPPQLRDLQLLLLQPPFMMETLEISLGNCLTVAQKTSQSGTNLLHLLDVQGPTLQLFLCLASSNQSGAGCSVLCKDEVTMPANVTAQQEAGLREAEWNRKQPP